MLLSRDMACIKLDSCFRPCMACVNLAYGALRRRILHAHTHGRTAVCLRAAM